MPKVSEPTSNSNSNIPVLTVSTKERYDVGDNIAVSFAFESSKTDVYDWIGIYSSPEKKKNGDYITYNYVGKAGETNGFVTFVVKSYGTYQFRYVRNQVVFARCQVEIGPVVELKADLKQKEDNSRFIEISTKAVFGSIPSKAWIGLFHKAEQNFKNWIQWDHASKSPLQFTNALKPGIYICRLFSVYDVLAISNEIVITGEDVISVEIKKELEITYELKTILNPYWEGAWFGLFTSSETDDHLWKLYCKIADPKGIAKIKLPSKSGSYDIRLYSGSKLIKRTPAFEVKLEK